MSTYVIGDVHGCFQTLRLLLERIGFDSAQDHLWFVGDLVNKGPDSLGVLRWAYEHREMVGTVLGNHDLHLLRCAHGKRDPKPGEGLAEVLDAPDAGELLDWLLGRPLMVELGEFVVLHAGIVPAWGVRSASKYAVKAAKRLVKDPARILTPAEKTEIKPKKSPGAVFALRVFTSVRCCTTDLTPDFGFSGPPDSAPAGLRPWYAFAEIEKGTTTFIFGHWARHGFRLQARAWCLDSSCVYGGQLSAVRLEDRAVFQVACVDGSYAGDDS